MTRACTAAALYVATLASALALAACSSQVQAPTNPGVCYHLGAMKNDKPQFNIVASSVPDMEHCAAQLEAMRVRFLSLGGTAQDIVGAYQGNFLFLGEQGVFTAETYQGPRYPFLVRNGDQLVPVGSAPQ
jgi:hypothetical protein